MHTVLTRRFGSKVALALGMASLTCASHSQVLNVPVKFTYKGSVLVRAYAAAGSCSPYYTVPAGVSFRITDFMLANYGGTTTLPYQYLCSGTTGCSTFLSAYITAPGDTTLINNYSTGPRLDTGTQLYVCNGATSGTAEWTINGYTYSNP